MNERPNPDQEDSASKKLNQGSSDKSSDFLLITFVLVLVGAPVMWYCAKCCSQMGAPFALSVMITIAIWILTLYIVGRLACSLLRCEFSEMRGFILLTVLLSLPILLGVIWLLLMASSGF